MPPTSSPISTCGTARFIWLGTTFPFDAFTFYFVENEHGVFQAHCYRFDEHTSTFIVECDETVVAECRLRSHSITTTPSRRASGCSASGSAGTG